MRIQDNNSYSKSEFKKTYPKISAKLIDKTISVLKVLHSKGNHQQT